MPQPSAEKLRQLRAQFTHFDTSGDGKLDLKEMSALLRRGNPKMTDAQLQTLFNGVDRNHDGRIDFNEFVAYIYSTAEEAQKEEPLIPEPPEDVHVVFQSFAGGSSMDGSKFAKLCRDCGVTDRTTMNIREVDNTFAKVAPKGKRNIQFQEFVRALGIIAQKKGQSIEKLYGLVGDSAPVTRATKADAVRFHDDKSTYTGTQAKHGQPSLEPERHEQRARSKGVLLPGIVNNSPSPRPAQRSGHRARLRSPSPASISLFQSEESSSREKSPDFKEDPRVTTPPRKDTGSRTMTPEHRDRRFRAEVGEDTSDLDWNLLDKAFFDYTGKHDEMDGHKFAKLCTDCGLYDRKFTRTDTDIIFHSVLNKGERRMIFGQFTDALKLVAQKKDVAPYFVQKAVLQSSGPKMHATTPDAVRFHDDKSTYTGTHAVAAA